MPSLSEKSTTSQLKFAKSALARFWLKYGSVNRVKSLVENIDKQFHFLSGSIQLLSLSNTYKNRVRNKSNFLYVHTRIHTVMLAKFYQGKKKRLDKVRERF